MRTSGKVLWSRDFKKDFGIKAPMWGFAGHPLLDGNRLICLVGGEGSTAVAFDKDTGKEIWRALSAAEPGYSSPMIYEAGGKRQLILWHPEAVNSLDPETGEVYWSVPFKSRTGMTLATPRKLGDWLFFTAFYSGSLMLRLDSAKPAATTVWRTLKVSEKDTTHLNAVMCTPFLEDGYIYGVCSYGQLRCLKMETGERVWETFAGHDRRRAGPLGQRVHREERRPLLPVQRKGRLDHREAQPPRLRGDQPRPPARTDEQGLRPARGLVASGLCQPPCAMRAMTGRLSAWTWRSNGEGRTEASTRIGCRWE